MYDLIDSFSITDFSLNISLKETKSTPTIKYYKLFKHFKSMISFLYEIRVQGIMVVGSWSGCLL